MCESEEQNRDSEGSWPRGRDAWRWDLRFGSLFLHRLRLSSSAVRQRAARLPSFSLQRYLLVTFQTSFILTITSGKCRPCTKLCRSWRPGTRAPSPTSLFHLFWMTARTFLSLAAKMGTRCYANGPAIGSARLSDTRAPFGVRNSVAMHLALRQAAQTLRRASLYHTVHPFIFCPVPLTRKFCA